MQIQYNHEDLQTDCKLVSVNTQNHHLYKSLQPAHEFLKISFIQLNVHYLPNMPFWQNISFKIVELHLHEEVQYISDT